MRKTRFGLPAFEHAFALLFIGAVVGLFSWYALRILEQAEATVVRATIMNIRSGLRLEQAQRSLRGQPPLAAGGNPVRFLQVLPAGYLSEEQTPQAELEPGSWYYRADQQTLFYQPRYRGHLRLLSQNQAGSLGWRVAEHSDTTKEVDIQTVTPYEWF